MIKRTVGLALVLVAATGAMAAEVVMPDLFRKGETILFIGDSVTHGGRCGDMNHYLGHGYQAEIAMRYLGYRPELELQFANRGISGDSSSNVVARWRSDAFPFTPDEIGYEGPYPGKKGVKRIPDWISIFVGLNDDWDLKYVPPADTERNIRFMIEDARKHNPAIKIVLCEPYSPMHKSVEGKVKTEVRCEIVRRLAAEYDVILVPFPKLFDELMKERPQSKWWIWDSCHPTYAAHMRMADFWLQTVAAWRCRQRR